MTERQFNRFITLANNLYKGHPNSITNYKVKMDRLNTLNIKNGKVNWVEVKDIFQPIEYLSLINALSKEEGYTKKFDTLDSKGELITSIPYQTPNLYTILFQKPVGYHRIRQDINNLDRGWKEWFNGWPFS